MSYSDVLGATRLYGDLLRGSLANTANNLRNIQMDYAPVNPYSSSAYVPRSARNIYTGQGRETPNPIAAAKELESGMTTSEKLMLRGSQGLTYASIANKISPFLGEAAQYGSNLLRGAPAGTQLVTDAAGVTTSLAPGAAIPPGSTATSMNLGPAALVYGLTRDQDPYSYSPMETAGTIGSSYLAAQQLAPYLGMGTAVAGPVGIGIGILLSMLGKRSARRKKRAAERKMKEYRDDMRDERYAAVEEGREEMQAQLMDQMARRRESMYDNQYGGNYNVRSRAEQGMKVDKNIVAEFTGNELVVNDQDALENDIARGNNKSAANRIRMAMKGGKITPGPETHKNNPMPVDSQGNIYAKGKVLPFKANKGAGIYDHATDQFKMDMDDDTVVKVVKKNMKKWKKNNMA
tara:strand:- start:890 stop:2104 length:1215 start_codon:yes stop_codon:yes gene_type:complete